MNISGNTYQADEMKISYTENNITTNNYHEANPNALEDGIIKILGGIIFIALALVTAPVWGIPYLAYLAVKSISEAKGQAERGRLEASKARLLELQLQTKLLEAKARADLAEAVKMGRIDNSALSYGGFKGTQPKESTELQLIDYHRG